jgi:hypothetical protein
MGSAVIRETFSWRQNEPEIRPVCRRWKRLFHYREPSVAYRLDGRFFLRLAVLTSAGVNALGRVEDPEAGGVILAALPRWRRGATARSGSDDAALSTGASVAGRSAGRQIAKTLLHANHLRKILE